MAARKPHITIFEFELSVEKIAAALFVPESLVLTALGDGRVASRWSEYWGAQVGNLDKAQNTNQEGFDLSTEVSSAQIDVSSKCLSKSGVRFQESKFQGSGRKCSTETLLFSLEKVDLFHIIDISEMPVVRIVTVHSRYLRAEVNAGRLKYTGWKAKGFYEFVDRTYDWEIKRVRLDLPTPVVIVAPELMADAS